MNLNLSKATFLHYRIPIVLLLLIVCSGMLYGQKTYNIHGSIVDTSGAPLLASTIMLLNMDSTYVDFARTDNDGVFEFSKIKTGNHLLKATFLGHVPVTMNVSYVDGDVDVGQIEMKEIATALMEVVVKAARAPIKIKGDTIEYDATTFRVPEGSSVEDLLKRMPGMEVAQDGSITSDGHAVTKVTVDGKEFFGADPKAATKNLPAEGISKVQVFDETTEQEEITGAEDHTNQNKAMNLELKEDFKSGAFGKVTGGYGTEDRYELKGNYNRFNDKIQFSLIGVTNNTGRNGLSWDDYQGFMGSESWSFGEDGTYGFGSGGHMRFISFGGQDAGLESTLQSIFFSGNQAGLPENTNGGINFNYDNKKTRINSYYFINRKALLVNRTSEKETFLDPNNALENSSSISDTDALGQKAEIEIRQEIDSLHTLTFKTQFAAVDNEGIYMGQSESRYENEDFNTNENIYSNSNLTDGYLINARATLAKKFKSDKRRRMGLNASIQDSNIDENQRQLSTNDFFDMMGMTAQNVLNQDYDNAATKDIFLVNALYVEPLGEKFALQSFYNFSNRQETGDREVVDIYNDEELINEFLTRDYTNDIGLNRIGTSLKYAHNGVNLSIGAAFQRFSLEGLYEGADNSVNGTVDKIYQNWIPNMSLFFSPFRNSHFNLSYNVNAQEPNIRNLQPVVDNSNPLYLREGNPELTPQIDHTVSMYFGLNKPLSGFRIFMNGRYSFYDDQIITDETISENLITLVRPVNYDGGNTANLGVGINLPLKTNKITLGLNFWSNIRNSNAFVNDKLNSTKSFSTSPSLKLNITPSDKFTFYLNASFRQEKTEYNINSQLNQKTKNFSYSVEMNNELLFGFKLSTDFRLNQFENDRLDLDEDIPILNISISKQFLKGNKGEFRLSLYDAFNQNVSISQFASNYSIVKSNTVTLARYAMLSFTYNIQGITSSNKNKRFYH